MNDNCAEGPRQSMWKLFYRCWDQAKAGAEYDKSVWMTLERELTPQRVGDITIDPAAGMLAPLSEFRLDPAKKAQGGYSNIPPDLVPALKDQLVKYGLTIPCTINGEYFDPRFAPADAKFEDCLLSPAQEMRRLDQLMSPFAPEAPKTKRSDLP